MEKNRESLPLDRKVTSRDVARVAGVSQSTVSRVFSDVNSVKPELKERVYRAAKEIGYRPNLVARGSDSRFFSIYPTFLNVERNIKIHIA